MATQKNTEVISVCPFEM